jgi:excisionase family DNA binding protein
MQLFGAPAGNMEEILVHQHHLDEPASAGVDTVVNLAAVTTAVAGSGPAGVIAAAPSTAEDKKKREEKLIPPDAMAVPIPEFARRLCVSQSFVWKLIKQGDIAVIKLGRRTLIPASEAARKAGAAA